MKQRDWRLDVLVSAPGIGYVTASVCPAFVCEEASCSSQAAHLWYWSVCAIATLLAIAALWKVRLWKRIVALPAIGYLALVVPAMTIRSGRWRLEAREGTHVCSIGAGEARAMVSKECGKPLGTCSGPKHIDSKLWLPVPDAICGFQADIYPQRAVIYRCDGGVDVAVHLNNVPWCRPDLRGLDTSPADDR
jgi:hypothetical protein